MLLFGGTLSPYSKQDHTNAVIVTTYAEETCEGQVLTKKWR